MCGRAVRWLAAAAVLANMLGNNGGQRVSSGSQPRVGRRNCPRSSCLCFGNTIRCMHIGLTSIPHVAPRTTTLDLRFNRIRQITASNFIGLKNLSSLLLNNNQIRAIGENAFTGLSSLKYLYLFKNKIQTIHKKSFKGLISLEQLYLHDNEIRSIPSATFWNLPHLERLFLHNNKISTLPSRLFNRLPNFKRVRLDSNPLRCDCNLAWLADYFHEHGSLVESATCLTPQAYAHMALSAVPADGFACADRSSNTAPVIGIHPEDSQVAQGQLVRFGCVASGEPQPTVSWQHNRQPIVEDARVRVLGDGTLLIQSTRRSDEGSYRCVAANSVAVENSREATLVYKGPIGQPEFVHRPRDVEVTVDDEVTLQCRVSGNPSPVTRWYRNRRRLPVTANYVVMPGSLHIRRISMEDNGTYVCMAANSQGSINTSATVLVRDAPTFTVSPVDQTAIRGQAVTLDCVATGEPAPRMVWLKDEVEIVPDRRHLIMSSGSLLIRSTEDNSAGTYTCRAQSVAGVSERVATVTVAVPPSFTVRPQNQRVRQGLTVDFQCQVTGRPQPHVVWTVNDRAVPDDPRYALLPSGTLRLLRALPSDAGVFRCEAANSVGAEHAQVALTVIPQTPLTFARSLMDVEANAGETVHIVCHVVGGGRDEDVEIAWTKDDVRIVPSQGGRFLVSPAPSSVLTIRSVGHSDGGRYECRARSGNDVIFSSMTLTVQLRSSAEQIIASLSDILPPGCLEQGCDSANSDGTTAHLDSFLLDEEVVRAFTSPIHDRTKRQSGTPNVINSNELHNAVRRFRSDVDRAINGTIQHFNDGRHRKTAGDLLSLMRFPATQEGIDMAKAAEVFDVSLRVIECCVKRGRKGTQPDFDMSSLQRDVVVGGDDEDDVTTLVGPEVMELVANLSGCSTFRKQPDCAQDICFHRKYRTSDGTCNNLHHPMWGASLTPFHRLLQPIYENGFNAPIAWNAQKLYNGHALPSPRSVSVRVLMSRDTYRHDTLLTHMVMQWGQFLDHDLDFTTMAPSIRRFSDGRACRDSCEREAPCFPIGVDAADARHGRFHHRPTTSPGCMEFTRSSAVCGSGITSVFFNVLSRREQINAITSYHDASNVYGSSRRETDNLRDLSSQDGLLKEGQALEAGQKPLLPYNVYSDLQPESTVIRPVAPIECRRGDSETARQRSVPCFLAGDLRANEQVGLTAMHTIWMREHNRVARYLKRVNAHWDGDTVFNEARKIIGAQMQHITYTHWLPKLLGPFMDLVGTYGGYNPNLPSSIVNVFATAAYRFGHTMINPIMYRLNETWQESRHGHLPLHHAFFAPFRIVHEGGIDPLIRGLIAKPMKARDSDSSMNEELIERLFSMAESVALDLGALNVQRGRDHALPFYNDWRHFCNLTVARSFDDLAGEIQSAQVRAKLEEVYKTAANIDPFVGMIVEDVVPGSRLGPTLGCLLSTQFKRTRDGDRFWYENPGTFSPQQLTALRQASLARIICDNADVIASVPRDVFLNQPQADFVTCADVPSIDLSAWVDCCSECSAADSPSPDTLSGHVRQRARSRRHTSDGRHARASRVRARREHRSNTTTTTANNAPHASSVVAETAPPPKVESSAIEQLLAVVQAMQAQLGELKSEVGRLKARFPDDDGADDDIA